MLFDTHSHLNLGAFDKDRYEVAQKCLDNNVWIINVGIDYESSRKAVEIAEHYKEGVFAAIGLHPENIGKENFEIERYENLAKSSKVVAIGEVGLDYWQFSQKNPQLVNPLSKKQKEVLWQQIALAQNLNLPVIFHCRKAHQDLIAILEEAKTKYSQLKGVIHCFTGNVTQAKKYLSLGFYLGFNGMIFKMNLDNIIKKVPLSRILIETDSPYLTPPQEKEKRNEPIFVKYIAAKIAQLKNVSFKEIASLTSNNAQEFFLTESQKKDFSKVENAL